MTLAMPIRLVAAVSVVCRTDRLQGELLELAMDDYPRFERENPKTAAFVKVKFVLPAALLCPALRCAIAVSAAYPATGP